MRFNALLSILRDLLAGDMSPDRAKALLDQIKPMEEPPRVPKLREVAPKRPP